MNQNERLVELQRELYLKQRQARDILDSENNVISDEEKRKETLKQISNGTLTDFSDKVAVAEFLYSYLDISSKDKDKAKSGVLRYLFPKGVNGADFLEVEDRLTDLFDLVAYVAQEFGEKSQQKLLDQSIKFNTRVRKLFPEWMN